MIEDLKLDLFDVNLFDRLKNFFEKVKKEDGGYFITSGLDAFGNPD